MEAGKGENIKFEGEKRVKGQANKQEGAGREESIGRKGI
jgi:hypothetical protein